MLGMILSPLGTKVPGQYPNEIQYSYSGAGTFEEPFDPRYNERGEAGLYYDTMLGGIPTDSELSTVYSTYTPVASAWVNAKEGFFPAPWRTPGGWNPAGQFGPQPTLSGVTLGLSPLGWGLAIAAGVGAFFLVRKLRK